MHRNKYFSCDVHDVVDRALQSTSAHAKLRCSVLHVAGLLPLLEIWYRNDDQTNVLNYFRKTSLRQIQFLRSVEGITYRTDFWRETRIRPLLERARLLALHCMPFLAISAYYFLLLTDHTYDLRTLYPSTTSNMSNSRIEYSEKYADEENEYRYVVMPKRGGC